MQAVMSTVSIREKLHSYLEVADDKKVKAIYAIMEHDIEESVLEYSDDMKNELDRRQADYTSGKSKGVSAAESKKRLQQILKSAKKK